MQTNIFNPSNIADAVNIFRTHGGKSVYLAGATDVMVKQEIRQSGLKLISLDRIPELSQINISKGKLEIGSMVTISDLETFILKNSLNLEALIDGISQIGSAQIRNIATIGGNICSSLPSADSIAPLIVLDAELVLTNGQKERSVKVNDFCTGAGKNILQDGEILKNIVIKLDENLNSAYIKHGRRSAMEIALIGAACSLKIDSTTDECLSIRLALTTAAPTHVRAPSVEEALLGKKLDASSIKEAVKLVLADVTPRDSYRCTAVYRKKVLPIILDRCIEKAINRRKANV